MKVPMSVLLVYSTSHALRIEKMLKEREIPCRLVPVPRHLSSDCGTCVRFAASDSEAAKEAVDQSGIEIQGIFEV
ncbi:hypothetical protein B4O97_10580 [Marispirochaeta aestuarii]|uniref:Putative Se/S carrier protein-like domain-containing protein n=1 Tax=Marispirochaeta aestuarii TaxID=1963862 RepID=A0A1Y1RYZ6_9SPIO|nr:DUF3343 domain-containing protein [Marispirochaeta aestuarii]ORC35167.1 hypothetical protein B4O97_10580 [Marispirochaeta aestuarii]